MKKYLFVVVVIGLAVGSVVWGAAPGGGSGDVPTPFLSSNQKVELAHGELYTLVGVIRFSNGEPFLEIDLNEHPWLANAYRKANPFYPLEGATSFWKRYENQRLKTFVEAHIGADALSDGLRVYITLNPLADPVVLETQRRRR